MSWQLKRYQENKNKNQSHYPHTLPGRLKRYEYKSNSLPPPRPETVTVFDTQDHTPGTQIRHTAYGPVHGIFKGGQQFWTLKTTRQANNAHS